jgi:hypothetical protein
MPEKPRPAPQVPIFRPRDYDRDELERARAVIKFAKKVLAESDPSNLLGRYKADPASSQSDPSSERQ